LLFDFKRARKDRERMSKKRETDILATESSGNVFAGLGLPDPRKS
jgi:hypothetical protein